MISVSLRPSTSSSWTHISTRFWKSARRWQLRAMILAIAPGNYAKNCQNCQRSVQLMSSKECHPSIFEGKSAAERHPQLPAPRIATWEHASPSCRHVTQHTWPRLKYGDLPSFSGQIPRCGWEHIYKPWELRNFWCKKHKFWWDFDIDIIPSGKLT